MADDSSVLVELQLAADQFEQALDRARDSFRSATAEMGDDAQDAGQSVDRAFSSLGVRSIEDIRYQIASLQQAFETLRTSGRVSAEDIERAEAALKTRISQLNAEITKTSSVSDQAGDSLSRAFTSLGVRSIEDIRSQISNLQQAFETLRTSGRVSAEDIERAEAALKTRVSQLNAEITKTSGATDQAGDSLKRAFGATGVRTIAEIEREIRSIEIALQRLGQDSRVTGEDFSRAFQSGQAKIKALEQEMAGVVQTTNRADKAAQRYSGSIGGVVRGMLAWVSAAAGLNRAVGFGKDVLDTGAAFEVLQARLTGLLGSSSQARQEMQNLKDLAATTPFEVMELSEAYTQCH